MVNIYIDEADELKGRLEYINSIIFAKGLNLGSKEYFEVRGLCTDHLQKLNHQECNERRDKMQAFFGKAQSDDELIENYNNLKTGER